MPGNASEHLPCGVVEFDDEGTLHHANPTIASWLGEAAGSLPGRKFDSLLSIANRIFFQTHFFPLLRLHGHAEEIFLALLSRGGERVPVITAAVRRDTPEGPRSCCVFLTVHQRRKYEDEILLARETAETALRNNEELRATKHALELRARELERTVREVQSQNTDLQQVIQVLSHDLREPIRKVGLFADLVRGEIRAEPETEAAMGLQKVGAEAAQMEGLINAMRLFLQCDARGPVEPVDPKALVEAATAAVAMKQKFTDWAVECEALPIIEGRRLQLHQLFVHLLENAVKFRERNRRLRVRVTGRVVQHNAFEATKDRYQYIDCAQIEVQDNGTGFDLKYREYAFQLLKKMALDSPGLGVGLAVCRKIVTAHYGSIRVDSQPGSGTTFTIILPLLHPAGQLLELPLAPAPRPLT